jgi:hypothetical protein
LWRCRVSLGHRCPFDLFRYLFVPSDFAVKVLFQPARGGVRSEFSGSRRGCTMILCISLFQWPLLSEYPSRNQQHSVGPRVHVGTDRTLVVAPLARVGTPSARLVFARLFFLVESERHDKTTYRARRHCLGVCSGLSACSNPYDPGQRAVVFRATSRERRSMIPSVRGEQWGVIITFGSS